MYISWIARTKNSMEFLEALTHSENVMLFANKNLQEIINFMWNISKSFFIFNVFLPFMVFAYIPIHVVALYPSETSFSTTEWICVGLLFVFFIVKSVSEIYEMNKEGGGIRTYFK